MLDTIFKQPQYVGEFDMYGVIMRLEKKPSFIKIFFMKHILGIVWGDYITDKNYKEK